MKPPSFLTLSLAGNLALAAVFVVLRQHSLVKPGAPMVAAAPPAAVRAMQPTQTQAAEEKPEPVVPWRQIASADYRQYIINLRAVECPEWLVRDIIVADIDDLYQQMTRTDPATFAPWQGTDERRTSSRNRQSRLSVIRQEKRALVKWLLGYEWDDHADRVWGQDLLMSLTLGFLPDDKAAQIASLGDESEADMQAIRMDANYIVIDEDRVRLQSVYEKFAAGLARQLDAAELDEFQLRAQQGFLAANDIHFAGVTISREELRQIVRMSKSFKDMARNDYILGDVMTAAGELQWRAAFDAQVQSLLGPERFADYQRAQDHDFREILKFTGQNQLPKTAAIKIYESRRNAAEQADEIQKDVNLSAAERTTALGVLKIATASTLSTALGGNYQSYLTGAGQWLGNLTQPPAAKNQ